MVKRKTVRKVYKKSRRKSIKRISRKTKRGGRKGIRTFKKKKTKRKGIKKRKLNKTVGNRKHRGGGSDDLKPRDTVYIKKDALHFYQKEGLDGAEASSINRYCINDIQNETNRATLRQWQFDGKKKDEEKSRAAELVPALQNKGVALEHLIKITEGTNANKIYMNACRNSTSSNKDYTIPMAEEYKRGWHDGQILAGEIIRGEQSIQST